MGTGNLYVSWETAHECKRSRTSHANPAILQSWTKGTDKFFLINPTYFRFRSLMLFKTWLIIAWIHSHDDILMAYERACWKSMNTIHGRSSSDNDVTKTYCYWCFSFYPLYSELILLSFLSSKFLPHNKVIYSSYTWSCYFFMVWVILVPMYTGNEISFPE